MTLEDFLENYSCAPYTELDIANGAIDVKDCERLRVAASNFVKAFDDFEAELRNVDFEWG